MCCTCALWEPLTTNSLVTDAWFTYVVDWSIPNGCMLCSLIRGRREQHPADSRADLPEATNATQPSQQPDHQDREPGFLASKVSQSGVYIHANIMYSCICLYYKSIHTYIRTYKQTYVHAYTYVCSYIRMYI